MKISSRLRRFANDYREASEAGDKQRLAELSNSPLMREGPAVIEALFQTADAYWLSLLPDLANLRPDGIKRLRISGYRPLDNESDDQLIALRDQLRTIWPVRKHEGKRQADDERQLRVFEQLLKWYGSIEAIPDPSKWMVHLVFGVVFPRFFRGLLARAFFRLQSHLSVCENPECPAPYFVAKKSTQIYCSQTDACARFAARKAARKYWRDKVGKQRRKAR